MDDGNGTKKYHEIVFTLDADLYLDGFGDDLEEILRLTASVHVDHPDPFNPTAPAILSEFHEGACFEMPEVVFCAHFK